MVTLVELGLVLLAVLFLFKLLKQVFRRTRPDDREPPDEDSLVTASLDNPRKPSPNSIKLDLPKDPD
jgi:hypothetical protein